MGRFDYCYIYCFLFTLGLNGDRQTYTFLTHAHGHRSNVNGPGEIRQALTANHHHRRGLYASIYAANALSRLWHPEVSDSDQINAGPDIVNSQVYAL